MCNALTVTKRESAPLPERLCERITYSTAMFAMWVNFSDKFVQCEGADHRFYSTPEMQNILLQNAVGHVVRKAKNFVGGATDTIFSGRPVLINLMSGFVLDKTKATAKGRQWVLRQIKLERITNNATFAAGGQSVTGKKFRWDMVGYSCSLALRRNRAVSACFLAFSASLATSSEERSSDALSILARPSLTVIFLGSSIITCVSLWLLLIKAVTEQNVTEKKFQWGYSCSLTLRRWRYSTSRFNAAVTNCPVLSPGIFTASTLFITSCGTLAATVCDFAFTAFVAMLCTPHKKQMQYAGKKISVQHLTCLTPAFKLVFNTLLMQGAETTKPRTVGAVTGLLTTNDNQSIEIAMLNHTTHPQGRDSHNLNKYIWRFIALSTAQPRVITIEATSEQEARQQSPDGCVMVFAARIRQEVHHA